MPHHVEQIALLDAEELDQLLGRIGLARDFFVGTVEAHRDVAFHRAQMFRAAVPEIDLAAFVQLKTELTVVLKHRQADERYGRSRTTLVLAFQR